MSAEEAVKNETMDTETGENAAAQDDEDERKFFVCGLPQDAKDLEIRENFRKYSVPKSRDLSRTPRFWA